MEKDPSLVAARSRKEVVKSSERSMNSLTEGAEVILAPLQPPLDAGG